MDNTADNERLISIIQTFPQLWDKSDPGYIDKVKREKAWKRVILEFFGEKIEDWEAEKNTMLKDVQKRWKNLRNCFARELAKRRHSKSGKSWKTYIYFEQMSFLLPSMGHAEYQSSLSPQEQDETDEDEDVETFYCETTLEPPLLRRKKKPASVDSEPDLTTVLAKDNIKWKREKEQSLENDSDKLFLLSLYDDFKKIPRTNKPAVKIAMINAIASGMYEHSQTPSTALRTALTKEEEHSYTRMG